MYRSFAHGFHQLEDAGIMEMPKEVSQARTRRPFNMKTASELVFASSTLRPADKGSRNTLWYQSPHGYSTTWL